MKLPCKVVEDILPLYYDGVCSEESTALVEEHLKDCPCCSRLLSDLRSGITLSEKKADDIRPLKKLQKSYRKMRFGWWVAALCFLVLIPMIIFISVWRFWPQSFTNLIPMSETSISGLSVYGTVQGIKDGEPFTEAYRIDALEQASNEAAELLDILKSSHYRQDLRNLLPWDMESVGADKNYNGQTVIISFYVGSQREDFVSLQFLSRSIVAVSYGDEYGFHIYHPTDPETFGQLAAYLQVHGINQ